MKTVVLYRSKYGSTKTYAEWIAEALDADVRDAKGVSVNDLLAYDGIVYGGGLYGEVINGVGLITKNAQTLSEKRIAVFSTGITPLDCRAYYDDMVIAKNFKNGVPDNVKVFNYLGKMKIDELTVVHRTAIKALKKLMAAKENPTDMEKLLVTLCDADGDFTDRSAVTALVDYMRT